MKKIDRFLVVIVAGIVVLVVVTLIVTLRQPAPAYQPENTPEGIAHNYILALQQKDYERAYSYLSPTLPGYPVNSMEFMQHTSQHRWRFQFDENTTVSISDVTVIGDQATVEAASNRFSSDGLFGGSISVSHFELQLRHENGVWKIVQADRYWANCWNQSDGCP
jgi:hypothetical protein